MGGRGGRGNGKRARAPALPRGLAGAAVSRRFAALKREHLLIHAAESAIHGRGVYARAAIPDGTRIVEYTGERITKEESKRREQQRLKRARRGGDGSVYIFDLDETHDLDGRMRNNVARLINHSCAPNCRAETIDGRIWILARRDIAVDAELTFDYGYSYKECRAHPCRCGEKGCPGFIVTAGQRKRLRRALRAERSTARRASAR